jgi:NAD(P)-dependent dehydrogenase (short-subunit alcohol dehydrogenase family)
MTAPYEGRVALVTGAGSGIGLATARAFAEAGAAVALADLNASAVRDAVAELTDAGHRALAISCDVSNEQQVAAMDEQTIATFGRLDAAYNNAGIHVSVAETADAEGADFDRAIGINLRGVL